MTTENYAMYSRPGNTAVTAMVKRLTKLPITTTEDELNKALVAEFQRVAVKFPEVWDTEVRECVIGRLEKLTGRHLSIYF